MSKSKKYYKQKEVNTWKYLIPLSIIVFLVPLIVYLKVVELTPIEVAYWKGGATNPDFFSYYKMVALLIFTTIGIISTGLYFKNTNGQLKKTSIYIPMGLYGLLIILSSLFAEHKTVALRGFADRYEGMYVLLAYLVIMFIAINLVNDEKSAKAIIYPLLASATIIGIIGAFQYIGKDFFQSDFGKNLILPGQYKSAADTLKFNFGEKTIYSTLYNTNYVGSYMAMLFPLALTMLILIKDIRKKILLLPVTILMFLNLIGSNSRGGMLGVAFAMIIFLIFIRRHLLKNWLIVIISLALLVGGVYGVNRISEGRVTTQVTRLKNEIVAFFDEPAPEDPNMYKIEDLSVEGDTLKIQTTIETLYIQNINNDPIFMDEDKNIIETEYNSETGAMSLLDERYAGYNIKVLTDGVNKIVNFNRSGFTTNFALVEDSFKYYRGENIFNEIRDTPSYGFEGKASAGSGRGFIWSRTIPLLKENIIVGTGPDTYAIHFPQDDLKGRFNGRTLYNNMIVDKPHNLYLQTGVNTGTLSLLAFVALVLIYIINSMIVYFKNSFDSDLASIGLGIFIGVLAYLVAGIFNDSLVSVAPVFWILIGTGLGINLKIKEQAIEKQALEK